MQQIPRHLCLAFMGKVLKILILIHMFDLHWIIFSYSTRLALNHLILAVTRTRLIWYIIIVHSLLGVQTRVPYADGSTENFEYLDPFIPYGHSDYFHTLVEAMVRAGGIRNVTIRGLPYDFRYAPTSSSGYE